MKNKFGFILIKPQLGENIGACARSLKNFGFSKLHIVSPKQSWPNNKAKATSVGAYDVIKRAKVYNNTYDAISDFNIIVSLSARKRDINKKHISINQFLKIIKSKKNTKFGFMFGPEASGLSNDEISYANYLVKIPTNKKFSSLNLSHSATIFCFELFQYFSSKKITYKSSYKSSFAKKYEVNKFLSFIIDKLDKKGFLQPNHKRNSMIRNINNIFHRLDLSEQEIRILLGIFSTLNDFRKKS